MQGTTKLWIAACLCACAAVGTAGPAHATARELVALQPAAFTFDRSILNQETFDIYRDPFDELQTRPFNLLFSNIGRHPNLTPWEGQDGQYTRYVNALIGNNGRSNIDNGVDAIQGSYIRRHGVNMSLGVSAAFLGGNNGSSDRNAVSTFSDADDVNGYDIRFAGARKLSETKVLGAGIRLIDATSEVINNQFDIGVGGNVTTNAFDQSRVAVDVGLRSYIDNKTSWDVMGTLAISDYTQLNASDTLDDTGTLTARLVSRNFEVSDVEFKISTGYNWQRTAEVGEREVRAGYERLQRDLDNANLAFTATGAGVTPTTTLLGSDALVQDRVFLSGKTVFAAGETEMFSGAEVAYANLSGGTTVDAQGVVANEVVDDSELELSLVLGVRQSLYRDKLRLVVSGEAKLNDLDQSTMFDTGNTSDSSTRTLTNYAVAIEGVLSNVVFDLGWLSVEEDAVTPVDLGVPSGSRRIVRVDRLVVSAAVSW